MTERPIPSDYGQEGDSYDDGTAETPPPVSSPSLQFGLLDATSFDHCDLAINTLLFGEDGHPQGRLVSIVVHNFGELRASRDFRTAELTTTSLLDNLQQGINAVVQEFLFLQAEARRKNLEAEAKRTARTASAPSPSPSVATPSPTTPVPNVQKSPPPPPPAPAPKKAPVTQYSMF